MKKSLLNLLAVALSIMLTLTVVEGMYAMWMSREHQTSLVYQAYNLLKYSLAPEEEELPWDPNTRAIFHTNTFKPLVDSFRSDEVALGNSWFHELRNEKTAMNGEQDGCKIQTAGLDKSMTYLNAGLYAPFAPVTAFHDYGKQLSPEVSAFINRYGFRQIRHRTNEHGERLTLPVTAMPRKVIVAGDSVANGAMLNDDETLSSRLQDLDRNRQYINIGIGGADASDILCALDRAAERYRGEIEELVYVYCENDFKDDKPFGRPEDVIGWLQDYVRNNGIEKTTVVYAPYLYNIIPSVTRFRGGYRGGRYDRHAEERRTLEQASVSAGFRYLDMGRLALEEANTAGTVYAAMSLFSDRAHWSPAGTSRVAQKLLAADAAEAAR